MLRYAFAIRKSHVLQGGWYARTFCNRIVSTRSDFADRFDGRRQKLVLIEDKSKISFVGKKPEGEHKGGLRNSRSMQ